MAERVAASTEKASGKRKGLLVWQAQGRKGHEREGQKCVEAPCSKKMAHQGGGEGSSECGSNKCGKSAKVVRSSQQVEKGSMRRFGLVWCWAGCRRGQKRKHYTAQA